MLFPTFNRKSNGLLSLADSQAAMVIRQQHRENVILPPKPACVVRESAVLAVERLGGTIEDKRHLLGQFTVQFGQFRDQTFEWMLSNALGYAAFLVVSYEQDRKDNKDARWFNKMALQQYVNLFPEGQQAIRQKRREPSRLKAPSRGVSKTNEAVIMPDADDMALVAASQQVESQASRELTNELDQPRATEPKQVGTTEVGQVDAADALTDVPNTEAPVTNRNTAFLKSPTTPDKTKTIWSRKSVASVHRHSIVDEMFAPTSTKKARTDDGNDISLPGPDEERSTATCTEVDLVNYPIYAKWKAALPDEDTRWISAALFSTALDKRGRRAFMVLERINKMWWSPPEPPFASQHPPVTDNYFGHRLFLWMPHKLWNVRLKCPHEDCTKPVLVAAGIYNKLRRVLDVSSTYLLASENLQCPACKRKVISWSHGVLRQLDIAKQEVFPCILTSMKACDKKVVRLLRERSLGNSCSQLQTILTEQHSEEWLARTMSYLSDCQSLQQAVTTGLIQPLTFENPPKMLPVPGYRWLMQVYLQDVLLRLPEVKAEITSIFGRILKVDSTKKIVNKLAGPVRGTAHWATNVGNELNQVLVSVVTTGEGKALVPMARGLMRRYQAADIPKPEAIYVDRDCCGSSPVGNLFSHWRNVPVRLDIWHFMRRFSGGCTSENHPLYGPFLQQLSRCIFMWDPEDLEALMTAKREELLAEHKVLGKGKDVFQFITKNELAIHCRRTTRGEAETAILISKLLEGFKDARDMLGVPVLKWEAMMTIWQQQQRHIACIQDPPGVQLYIKTGTLKKGQQKLPVYRCARGSTSLENFHLHMNRFIPGTLASQCLFQAYLLEGIARWNKNREPKDVGRNEPLTYNQSLQQNTNRLSEAVFGFKILPSFNKARKYSGEQIG